jgi:hypothetical protein
MLVPPRDARRSQQSLTPRSELAVATCDSAVFIVIVIAIVIAIIIVLVLGRAGGQRLPARPCAQRTNLRLCELEPRVLDASQICHLDSSLLKLYQLTLRLKGGFRQVRNRRCLCTTCEGVSGVVER